MIYEQEQIKEIAEEVRQFLTENHLAKDFVKRISGNHNVGKPVPEIEDVIDNGCMRYDLVCFLSYRISIMEESDQQQWGRSLVDKLDEIDRAPEKEQRGGLEKMAWDVAELLEELDYFQFARYMKCLDQPTDPVRRIYTDLKIPEKRAELEKVFLEFKDTGYTEQIQAVLAEFEEMGRSKNDLSSILRTR